MVRSIVDDDDDDDDDAGEAYSEAYIAARLEVLNSLVPRVDRVTRLDATHETWLKVLDTTRKLEQEACESRLDVQLASRLNLMDREGWLALGIDRLQQISAWLDEAGRRR